MEAAAIRHHQWYKITFNKVSASFNLFFFPVNSTGFGLCITPPLPPPTTSVLESTHFQPLLKLKLCKYIIKQNLFEKVINTQNSPLTHHFTTFYCYLCSCGSHVYCLHWGNAIYLGVTAHPNFRNCFFFWESVKYLPAYNYKCTHTNTLFFVYIQMLSITMQSRNQFFYFINKKLRLREFQSLAQGTILILQFS